MCCWKLCINALPAYENQQGGYQRPSSTLLRPTPPEGFDLDNFKADKEDLEAWQSTAGINWNQIEALSNFQVAFNQDQLHVNYKENVVSMVFSSSPDCIWCIIFNVQFSENCVKHLLPISTQKLMCQQKRLSITHATY